MFYVIKWPKIIVETFKKKGIKGDLSNSVGFVSITHAPQGQERFQDKLKQVTRGHNIVADGWAGASNPHPHPMPPHQHTYPKKYLKRSFFHFSTRGLRTDRRTDGPTDGQSLL